MHLPNVGNQGRRNFREEFKIYIIMNDNKNLKLFSLLFFVAFASVSCWATAESLHLLLPQFPVVFCWIVTIGFFIVASIGTKLIVDSLNQNIYLEKRGTKLVGGFVILLVFWLVCSMPTNTHTFFYRSVIGSKVSQDISMTKSYLDQIRNNTVIEDLIKARVTELHNAVEIKLGELEAEIKNPANLGFGPKSEDILRQFAEMLSVVKVEPLSNRGYSVQDRQKLVDAYRQKIYTLRDAKAQSIVNELRATDEKIYTSQATTDYKNLELVEKYIDDGTLDVNDADDIKEIDAKLIKGYSTIKTYEKHVTFQTPEDKDDYTSPNQVTKVKRMLSVIDVWKDFIDGKYAGQGFLFWIIISVLVDIAAFIFFDLSFKKRE